MKFQYFLNIYFLINFVSSETSVLETIYTSLQESAGDFSGFVRDETYSYISGKKKNNLSLCVIEPISQCSCIEMFYGFKNLTPNIPVYDEQDIKTKARDAKKNYHPDHLSHNEQHIKLKDMNEPFRFIIACQKRLIIPKVRKSYNIQLKKILEKCIRRNLTEDICRLDIMDLNHDVIFNQMSDDTPIDMPEGRDFDSDMETLHVFLDDSGSMAGDPLIKAKEILQQLSYRLYESNTNIYFIGSKDNSRRILSDGIRLNEDNINSMIFNIWRALSGGTYLWQFIWNSIESVTCIDCELVIITDGFDNESDGEFNGPTGFDVLMSKLKARNKPLPRVFIYCVSEECEDKIGKNYKELALASGGFFCHRQNYEDCNDILNQPHALRLKLKRYFQQEYFKLLEKGEVRQLTWIDKDEL